MDVSALLEKLNAEFRRAGLHMQRCCGETHNIFSILNIQRSEVLVCRFLGYLLDPSGGHGYGPVPLKSFLKEIGAHADFTEQDYQCATVKLEEHTDADRRVDIAVYIADEVIPIEVKIGAGDQKAQLYDYYKYYADVCQTKVKMIYYLTPNGTPPSNESISSLDATERLNPGQYKTISFKTHMQSWLHDLPSENDPNNLIAQFKEVIQAMCREYEDRDKLLALLALEPGETQPSEYLELLATLLENGGFLWEKLRKQYLLNALVLGSLAGDYILTDWEETDLEKDPYCLLALKRKADHKTVAWICVETNLYIVIEHNNNIKEWRLGNDCQDYFWRYLHPDGPDKPFSLRSPNGSIRRGDEIRLDTLLAPVFHS